MQEHQDGVGKEDPFASSVGDGEEEDQWSGRCGSGGSGGRRGKSWDRRHIVAKDVAEFGGLE